MNEIISIILLLAAIVLKPPSMNKLDQHKSVTRVVGDNADHDA